MAFTFTSVIEADAGTQITSDVAVVSGLTLGTKSASIVGSGQMSVDGGAWGTTGSVQNGSTVALRVTTPPEEDGAVTVVTLNVISLGYVTWTITNKDNVVDEAGEGADTLRSFCVAPGAPMSEVANGFDTTFPDSFVIIAEIGTGGDTLTPNSGLKITVIETAAGDDDATAYVTVTVAELAAGVDMLIPALAHTMLEAGIGVDTVEHLLTTTTTLTESGTGVDKATPSVTVRINETGSGVDTLLIVAGSAEQLDELGVGADVLVLSQMATFIVDEAGEGDDDVMPHTSVSIGYTEAAVGSDHLIYANKDRSAHVMNMTTGAYSKWQDLNVSEVFSLGGKLYGVGSDGLFRLSDVAGTSSMVYAGILKMKSDMAKRVPEMFVEAASEQPLRVGVVAVDQGQTTYEYEAIPARTSDPTNTRIPLGKGLRSTYFGITLANTGDAVTRVGEVSFSIAETKRRS